MIEIRLSFYGKLGDSFERQDQYHTNAATAAALRQQLAAHNTNILEDHVRIIINDEICDWQHPLADGDDIAFIPAVSGG